tara:strand:+ start:534 stop:1001 length:468 start_codon:yes stop_codon:yes gene_type:complete
MGAKLPQDRKMLNVLWNHINKPSYYKARSHTARECTLDKRDFYQLFMNHMLDMRDKFPASDGRLCRYCEHPLTFVPGYEKSKAEKKIKNAPKRPLRSKILTNISVDRLNSLLPYTYHNIVFCCVGCNQRKNACTPADLLNFIRVLEEKEREPEAH